MIDTLQGALRMIPEPPAAVVMIDNNRALADFIRELSQSDWVALDTEFVRERTYYPQLGLVQITNGKRIGLIDVLALTEVLPLTNLLQNKDILKVLHAPDQDLEVLNHYFGQPPVAVFDTQMAAALAGLDHQIGYARLVEALLGKKLPKDHTRTNWLHRPLPTGPLAYAADDVRYLAVVYPILRTALWEADRLAWLDDDFTALTRPEQFQVDTSVAWRRLRHRHLLAPASQQVLAELADWREQKSMAADRPRRWILADDALMAIAEGQPTTDIALADTPGLPHKTLARYGNELLDCVRRGLQRPACALDNDSGRPDPETRRLIKAGMNALKQAAQQTGIAAGAIASRTDVAALVNGQPRSRLQDGWRYQVAGQAVQRAIQAAASTPRLSL